MKVALVCPYALDVPGGVQGQSSGLAGALAARGHEVTLVAPGAVVPLPPGVRRVSTGRARGVPANGSVAPLAFGPGSLVRSWRALHGATYDVVHLEEPFAPAACLVGLLASGAPVVATFHRAGAGRAYRSLRPLLGRLAGRVASAVAVSAAAAATAGLVAGRGIDAIVPNGVDVARFVNRPERDPAAPRRIVFVGRHEPRKGLPVLLEAFAKLPGECELLVVGRGPQTATLQARTRDPRVRWLGRLDDEELAATLAATEVFCGPSIGGESFGVVLLEAMAAGCAVVASDLPGYREAGGTAARYVPPGDAATLAFVLGEVLADDTARDALAREGRARAEAHSFSALAERYERIYLGLVA